MAALTAGVALAMFGAVGTVAFAQTSNPAQKTPAAPTRNSVGARDGANRADRAVALTDARSTPPST